MNTLLLAEPIQNILGKTDILLGADFLEDIFRENRIRDNGGVIRESLFGLVVSGPVREVSSPLDCTLSTSVSGVSL